MNIKSAQNDSITIDCIVVVRRFAKSGGNELVYKAFDLLVDLENKHQILVSGLIVLDRTIDCPSHVVFGIADVREVIAETQDLSGMLAADVCVDVRISVFDTCQDIVFIVGVRTVEFISLHLDIWSLRACNDICYIS